MMAILNTLRIIMDECPSLDLHLNLGKCVVLGNDLQNFPKEITRVNEGLVILGTQIGSEEFIRSKESKIISNSISLM